MVTLGSTRVDEKFFVDFGSEYWFEESSIKDLYKNWVNKEPRI